MWSVIWGIICPNQPRPPQNVPFSHDPVPPPFTGQKIFPACVKKTIYHSSDISTHRPNTRLLFGKDLPAQCFHHPSLLARATVAGDQNDHFWGFCKCVVRPLPCPLLVSLLAVCLALGVTASVLFWNYTETRYLIILCRFIGTFLFLAFSFISFVKYCICVLFRKKGERYFILQSGIGD